jgi:hypothetical protein
LVVGGLGVALPTPLHLAQARMLEAHGDWPGAIREYELAGPSAPDSQDLARVYDEWGDALQRQGDYRDAINEYETTIASYPNATDEVVRAQNGDAQARYFYGAQLLARRDYATAAYEFERVQTLFPGSWYASRSHLGAATAYYGLGQQELTYSCLAARDTYHKLIGEYAGTPEGAKARADLAAPVTISGHVVNYPAGSAPTVYLSANVRGSSDNAYLSDDYHVYVNSTGAFTFKGVPQGKYNVSADLADGSGWYWFYDQPSYDPYVVVAGPLCPVDAGTFTFGGGFTT